MRKIERVGIIGAGGAAALHLAALRRLRSVTVVGICDREPDRAVALAAGFGAERAFVDPEQLFAARPQIVHIVTPPGSHYALARAALERGIHVLVEKPPALTVEGCDVLRRLAQTHRVTIGVDENTAFDPLVRKAAGMISAGEIGDMIHIDSYFSFGLDAEPPGWIAELPGGLIEDLLPHLLTTTRVLAGRELHLLSWHLAATGRPRRQRPDALRVLLAGEGGLMVGLSLSLSASPEEFAIAVRGTRASLHLDLRNMLLRRSRVRPGGRATARGGAIVGAALSALAQTGTNAVSLLAGRRTRFGSPLPLIRAHYAALEADAEPPAPLLRAVETVAIARAIWPLRAPVSAAADGAGNR